MFGKNNTQDPDYELFTIYDVKSQSYRIPGYSANKYTIIRDMENLMKNPQEQTNELVTNPEDFQLFKIGSYWKKTGKIECTNPEHIANLHEIKASLAPRAL